MGERESLFLVVLAGNGSIINFIILLSTLFYLVSCFLHVKSMDWGFSTCAWGGKNNIKWGT